MRYLLPTFLAVALIAQQPLRAQSSTDAGDLFVTAYTAIQQADKMEKEGNYRGSLNRLRYASDVLNTISQKYPEWSPQIISYRKQRTAESIKAVTDKSKTGGGMPSEIIPAPGAIEGKLPGEEDIPAITRPRENTSIPEASPTDIPPRPRGNSTIRPRESTSDLEGAISQMRKLQSDLRDAQLQADRAEKEKKELVTRYNEALKAREASELLQQKLQNRADAAEARLQEEQQKTKVDQDKVRALQAEAAEARRLIRAEKIDHEAEVEVRKQLNDRLQAAQARITKITAERDSLQKASKDAPMKIQQLEGQLQKANEEKRELSDKLTDTRSQLEKMTGQRDDALKQLTQLREASKNVDKLVSENAALMAKLSDAEKAVANFKAEGEEKDRQIAALKSEVVSVKEQLAKVRTDSANFQRQMGDLQARLDDQAKQLAQAKSDTLASNAERKKMQAENDILRGIVLRQQQQEARRTATKKMVLAELAKLDVNSKTLLNQIDFLSQPVVKLTAKELDLFKKPSMSINKDEISANKPPEDGSLPTDVPAETTPDTTAPTTDPVAGTEKTPAGTVMEMASLPPGIPNITPGETLPKTNPIPEPGSKDPNDEPASPGSMISTGNTPNIPAEFQAQARDGKELFEKGDYRGAEKIYEKILAKVPNNLYILSNLGVVRFRAGKYKQAEEVLIRATKVAPEDSFSHCTLGIVYYTEQKLDEAVSSLTKALAINPKNATAHNYLGITAAGKGWQEAALKELETACTMDPSYADAHFNLAVVFATQTPPNKEKARQYYKRATELGAEADSEMENLLKDKTPL